MSAWKNQIYFGDNLKILHEEIASESVDLVYLDPPFNSNANYNVLFKEQSGERSAAQVRAFDDTWHWTHDSAAVYQDLVTSGPRKLAELLQALLSFLGHNDVMAYLVMMAARLVELHRVLKSTGSIYLHCDPTASHYLKLVLDAVFGGENFKTEIVWKRSSAHSDGKQGRRQHGRIHDVIFYYTKLSGRQVWNTVHIPYEDSYLGTFYRHTEPETGRRYTLGDLAGPGGAAKGNPSYEVLGVTRHWRFSKEKMAELLCEGRVVQTKPGAVPRYKRYLDEMQGVPLQDVWTDIPPIGAHAQERLGYPTQKPEALLERIIQASSNEGDVILDPFCGCGTAVAVAERLKRRWIGIDITYLAINLVQRRLRDNFRGDLAPYVVHGAPTDLANATALKNLDPFQFEWWAVDLVDARPAKDRKRGADSGVDGYIYFFDDHSGQAKKLIVQVKSGHVGVHHIRDLKGTMEREQAAIGAFLTLEDPTSQMKQEAAAAGFYQPPELPGRFPRIQIRTIAEILEGKRLEFPPYREVTFAKAERKSKSTQPGLFRQGSPGDD